MTWEWLYLHVIILRWHDSNTGFVHEAITKQHSYLLVKHTFVQWQLLYVPAKASIYYLVGRWFSAKIVTGLSTLPHHVGNSHHLKIFNLLSHSPASTLWQSYIQQKMNFLIKKHISFSYWAMDFQSWWTFWAKHYYIYRRFPDVPIEMSSMYLF